MAQRMIKANGVELCAEAFGDPRDPAILLVMGIGASMLWWEEDFCAMLADGRRFVIRYDHRDTGRSVTYEPGRPEYAGGDLVADAAGVLDAYELAAGHIVGVSTGAAFAQVLALDAPDRVRSLILISSSPAVAIERALPAPTGEFGRFVSTARVDWSDADSVIEHLVEYTRVLAGGERPFAPACCDWRAPATESTGVTGRSSSERSLSRVRSANTLPAWCRLPDPRACGGLSAGGSWRRPTSRALRRYRA